MSCGESKLKAELLCQKCMFLIRCRLQNNSLRTVGFDIIVHILTAFLD